MAKQRFEKGSEEWQMFTDYWNLCQEVWQTEDSEEYWHEAYEKCKEFGEKYKGVFGDFARKLSLSLLYYIGEKGARK